MKKIVVCIVACLFLVPSMLHADEPAKATPHTDDSAKKSTELKTFQEKLSYSMGLDVGTYFKGIGDEIDFATLVRGIEDAFKGNPKLMTTEEMAAVQKEFAQKMKVRQEESLRKIKETNKKSGDAFLAENQKKKGVVVTKSGLQYEVLKKGNGQKPKAADKVKVDYVGKLIDGTEFDNSIKRGEPAVFGVDQVIPGWSEALQLMDVGSKYRIVIPSDLAYGEHGAPPVIEPNSVLVFEVELHSIEPEKK
jgi:FKBP-type peptidyl-prolyl cis-trans isomerase